MCQHHDENDGAATRPAGPDRRTFLKTGAVTAVGAAAFVARVPAVAREATSRRPRSLRPSMCSDRP